MCIRDRLHSISQNQVDSNAWKVAQLIEETDPAKTQEFIKEAENLKYRTALFRNGRVVGGADDEHMEDLAEFFQSEEYHDGQTEVFTFLNATIVGKYFANEEIYIAAVHSADWGGKALSLNSCLLYTSRCV